MSRMAVACISPISLAFLRFDTTSIGPHTHRARAQHPHTTEQHIMAQFTFRIGGGGESAESNALLRADFEPVAWLQGALADERGVKATSSQIESDLNLVNQELGSAVSKEYNTMLTNVHSTRALESKLSRSNDRVETLAQAVQRIQNQCAQPYSKLSAATQTLKRMQDCSELLRRAQRVVVLCKRMRESMSPTSIANTALPPSTPSSSSATPDAARTKQAGRLSGIAAPRRADLAKAASALHELEDVLAPFDALREVDVVRAEMDFIRETADSIRSQAKATLSQGIVDHSQAHIGTALQIFFNLGDLRAALVAGGEHLALASIPARMGSRRRGLTRTPSVSASARLSCTS